ncbi:MAG: hypothetical protein JXR59_00280 [Desulfuromonadaceae bacterium]|nr:hypothetical protein [Desulfuromonadaceae bacterium]
MLRRLLVVACVSGGGWLGWTGLRSTGFMTAYFAACFGSAAGLYLGRKLIAHLLE